MTSEAAWGRISDIAEINPETTNSNWNGREIFYIDIASVGTGVYNSEPEPMLYDEAPSRARRVVKHGDVLISTVRPNRRSMIQILNPAENTVASTGFALLRPKRKEDSDYLFGIICDKQYTLELEMLAYGAAYPAVSTDDICRPSVYLPGKEERDRVSRLLGSISELNQSKRSGILHEYVSAIFRSWFIDFDPVKAKAEGKLPFGMNEETAALFPDTFTDSELGLIPTGWELKRYSDCMDLKYGGALKAEERIDGQFPVMGSNGVVGNHNEYLVNGPGIVIGRKGNPGTVNWIDEDFFPIDTTFYAQTKDENIPLEFLYHSLKFASLPWFSADSAVPGINRNVILQQKFIRPPIELIEAFRKISETIFQQSRNARIVMNSIESLRDALLPRLMYGEITVPEAA